MRGKRYGVAVLGLFLLGTPLPAQVPDVGPGRCVAFCGGGGGGGGGGMGGMGGMNSMVLGGMMDMFFSGLSNLGEQMAEAERQRQEAIRRAREEAERRRREEIERRRQELLRQMKAYASEKQSRHNQLARELAMLGSGGPGPGVVDMRGMGWEQANQNLMAAQARMMKARIDRDRQFGRLLTGAGPPELSERLPPRVKVRTGRQKPLLSGGDLVEIAGRTMTDGLGSALVKGAARKAGGLVSVAGDFGINLLDEGNAWMDMRNAGLDSALKTQKSALARIKTLEEQRIGVPRNSDEGTRIAMELSAERRRLAAANKTLGHAAATSPGAAMADSLFNAESMSKATLKTLPVPSPVGGMAKQGFKRFARRTGADRFLAPYTRSGLGDTRTRERAVRAMTTGVTGRTFDKLEGNTLGSKKQVVDPAVGMGLRLMR